MFNNKHIFQDLQSYVKRIESGATCSNIVMDPSSPSQFGGSPSSRKSQVNNSSDEGEYGTNQHGIFPAVDRIVAIGDIHGDFEALVRALYKAKIMTTDGDWNPDARNTVVVQLGDLLDRKERGSGVDSDNYMEEIHILQLIEHLHNNALEYGSAFITLIGNHELMNMLGDFRYVSDNAMQGMGGKQERHKLFAAGGPIAKHIGCSSFGICKIGNWTFVHAGILPQHLENDAFSFTEVNKLVKEIMMGNITKDKLSPAQKEFIFGNNGLFWTRELSQENPNCKVVDDAVHILNNGEDGGIVVGHTVQDTINSKCDGKIWRIDGGMSGAFGDNKNKIYVLEILNNRNPHVI